MLTLLEFAQYLMIGFDKRYKSKDESVTVDIDAVANELQSRNIFASKAVETTVANMQAKIDEYTPYIEYWKTTMPLPAKLSAKAFFPLNGNTDNIGQDSSITLSNVAGYVDENGRQVAEIALSTSSETECMMSDLIPDGTKYFDFTYTIQLKVISHGSDSRVVIPYISYGGALAFLVLYTEWDDYGLEIGSGDGSADKVAGAVAYSTLIDGNWHSIQIVTKMDAPPAGGDSSGTYAQLYIDNTLCIDWQGIDIYDDDVEDTVTLTPSIHASNSSSTVRLRNIGVFLREVTADERQSLSQDT